MADQTFGWHKKMRKTDDFSSVFHFRCLRRGKLLDVSAGPNQLASARLGMIVPKKFIPTAVGRNRVKRLLREWFRLRQAELGGLDIIARLKAKPPSSKDAKDGQQETELTMQTDFVEGLTSCKDCVTRRINIPQDI